MTTGKVYDNFDELIKRVEKYISLESLYLYRCNSDQVRKRIIQKIVELTYESFSQQALKIGDVINNKSSQLLLNNICVETLTGKVSISAKFLAIQIYTFLVEWGRILWNLLIGSLFNSFSSIPHVTILAEVGGNYINDDIQLVEFCRKGPILPLWDGLLIIGTSSHPKIQRDKNIIYTNNPYIESAIRTTNYWEKVRLIFWHLLCPLIILHALLFNRLLLFIGKDIAFLFVMTFLDRNKKLKDVFITTSHFTSQAIWLKGLEDQFFRLNMVWYSQNFIPKTYVGETKRFNLPSARHMRVDKHWVWTDGFKDYLLELGQSSEIFVVGPLLWYLESSQNINISDKHINIAIFDINPLPDGKYPFGAIKNYYTTSLMKKFIIDILDLKEEIENISGKKVNFFLKHKRVPNEKHDTSYFQFLSELSKQKRVLFVSHPSVNLYDLIRKTNFSISVPYTSTCYVSAFCKKNAIYYDSLGELTPIFEQNEFIKFASGPINLNRIIKNLI